MSRVTFTDRGMEGHPAYDAAVADAAFGRGDREAVGAMLRLGLVRLHEGEAPSARAISVDLETGRVDAGCRVVGNVVEMTGGGRATASATVSLTPKDRDGLSSVLREGLGMSADDAAALASGSGASVVMDGRARTAMHVALVAACGRENAAVAEGRAPSSEARTVASFAGVEAVACPATRGPDPRPADDVRRIEEAARDGGRPGTSPDGRLVALWVTRVDLAEAAEAASWARKAEGPEVDRYGEYVRGPEASAYATALAKLTASLSVPEYSGKEPTGGRLRGEAALTSLGDGFGAGAQRRIWVERSALERAGTEVQDLLAGGAEDRARDRAGRSKGVGRGVARGWTRDPGD